MIEFAPSPYSWNVCILSL